MAIKKKQFVELPIEWHYPEGLISRYANNITVQRTETEVIISFFETCHPLVLGTQEKQKEQLESMKSIRAVCVSRILVSPDQIGKFIEALQTNYQSSLPEITDKKVD